MVQWQRWCSGRDGAVAEMVREGAQMESIAILSSYLSFQSVGKCIVDNERNSDGFEWQILILMKSAHTRLYKYRLWAY